MALSSGPSSLTGKRYVCLLCLNIKLLSFHTFSLVSWLELTLFFIFLSFVCFVPRVSFQASRQ
jgi:hypothetical protein